VRLVLALAPSHADGLEVYWRLGLWPRIEQLKRELAQVVAGSGADAVLWDFLEYSDFTAEPVPPPGDRHTATRWFWEPSHFKTALGHLLVARVVGDDATPFGAVITPASVEDRNAVVRRQRDALYCDPGRRHPEPLAGPPDPGCTSLTVIGKNQGPT
jgi:hypothetical protein